MIETWKKRLRERHPHRTDAEGYVDSIEQNLVDGVVLSSFEDNLRRGDGDELRQNFRAAHSSAALAVNCFAWFKPHRLHHLSIGGMRGTTDIRFEHKLPIFQGGRHPNMDVWIEREADIVAIESKLTEYFKAEQPKFSPAYERLAPPDLSEPCWWDVKRRCVEAGNLNTAQLLKHYFGLRMYRRRTDSKLVRFLYIFLEPKEWESIGVCVTHRKQCEDLAEATKDSEIPFEWTTYSALWSEWERLPELQEHASNLRTRYEV